MAAGIATLAILVIVHVFDYQTSAITRGTSTQIGVPTTTTLLRGPLLGADLHRGRVRLPAVALRLAPARVARERARGEVGRASRSPVERAIAWALSGFVVGVAGALYGHYFGGTFGPDDFWFNNGFNIVLLTIAMLVVGGMTSVTGAVVGCYFITIVYEVVPALGGERARAA